MMRKVYLEGEIADKFGSEFDMNVSTFGEALNCFELNFQEFREYMWSCHERGIGFICSVGDEYIEDENKLLLEHPKGSFTIQAIPVGSKRAITKIITAIILIYIGYTLMQIPGGQGFLGSFVGSSATLTYGQVIGMTLISMGVSLGLAGIQQMMAPDPSVDSQQDESYLFQGSNQNIIEGDPVPILYGKLRIPGRPISFEIKNQNRGFVDYVQTGYDYVLPGDSGDTNPDTGPDYDYDRSRDHDGDQGFDS